MTKELKLTSEEKQLIKGIHTSGGQAYKDTLTKGISVSVVEGQKIYRVRPDGKRTVVGHLNAPKKGEQLEKLKFRIK
jgi:hypothetical protein